MFATAAGLYRQLDASYDTPDFESSSALMARFAAAPVLSPADASAKARFIVPLIEDAAARIGDESLNAALVVARQLADHLARHDAFN